MKAHAFGETLPTRSSSHNSEPLSEKGEVVNPNDGEEPTVEEKRTLRHVGEMLPARIWLVAVVELCERFTYYGMQGLFQNYVSHAKDGSDGQKGLGKLVFTSVADWN
jgi:POT family proton-dependent oligopeptide transporter